MSQSKHSDPPQVFNAFTFSLVFSPTTLKTRLNDFYNCHQESVMQTGITINYCLNIIPTSHETQSSTVTAVLYLILTSSFCSPDNNVRKDGLFFFPQQQMEEGKHVLLNKQCVDYKTCKKWLKQKEMFLPGEVIQEESSQKKEG